MRHPARVISVVIAALNERAHIARCVGSILEQEVEHELEVIVVDEHSHDGTAELARAAGATVVENPGRGIPAALNHGLATLRGEVLVRFDAHAEMPPGYIAACLRALAEEQGAVNVGGWREARGSGPWARATGTLLASPLGVGNARIWRRPPPGEARRDVDTVPLGCFPVAELRATGGWNEQLLANEDYELNHRLRGRGGRVVFDPAIWSIYHPRETLRALGRQYWNYGRWKAVMLEGSPESLKLRQLAPPALLAVAAAAPFSRIARAGLGAYGLALGGVAVRSGDWRTGPALATMHGAWGAGLLRGLASAESRRWSARNGT